jgi:hypothetical protein
MLPLDPSQRIHTVDVFPDFGGVGGLGGLSSIVGALLTVVLILAAFTLIASGVTWALSAWAGNHSVAGKAQVGLFVAVAAAAFAGAGIAWMNFLIALGSQL